MATAFSMSSHCRGQRSLVYILWCRSTFSIKSYCVYVILADNKTVQSVGKPIHFYYTVNTPTLWTHRSYFTHCTFKSGESGSQTESEAEVDGVKIQRLGGRTWMREVIEMAHSQRHAKLRRTYNRETQSGSTGTIHTHSARLAVQLRSWSGEDHQSWKRDGRMKGCKVCEILLKRFIVKQNAAPQTADRTRK